MGVADYQPGDYVSTPAYGPCAVRGVETDPLAGECLAIEPLAHSRAIVRVPVSKLSGAHLRVVTAADAEAMLATWQPPRGKWNHIPVNVQRARRIAHLRSFRTA
jgi:RNA polymerase-interacting CarD/CdnL/TRCF family regulator